jgi:predicted dehydrogenase
MAGPGGSPADRLRVGVIGVRSQGKVLAVETARLSQVDVVAVCDVDESMRRRAVSELAGVQPLVPRGYRDFRGLLDDPRVDAVLIATPDHWHAVMASWAVAAGKDVYLESPVTHALAEGRALRAVVEQSGRLVQCGVQERSGAHFRTAVALVRSGELGIVRFARAWSVQRRALPSARSPSPPPPGVDFDLWLGPRSERPFDAAAFHHHWRWQWDFGGGELAAWGTHLLDVARWGLGVDWPTRVAASGSASPAEASSGPAQTPDTLTVQYTFPEVTLQWEHRTWSHHGNEGRHTGVAFYGDRGTLVVDRSGWKVYDRDETLTAPASELRRAHLEDFFDAVRTRRPPNCDLQTGLVSSGLCHLGNVSYRLGREVRFDPLTETCLDDPQAQRLLSADYRLPWQLLPA